MAAKLDIWNDALGELPSAPVTTDDELTLERRECERVYEPCLKELLEIHDWGFANRRVVLAKVTNTRNGEWLYAYAVPADMGTAQRILPGWLFERDVTSEAAGLYDRLPPAPYIIEAGVIFTNEDEARLEYGVDMVSEAEMPALFVRALALEMASRLAMPIKKDRVLKGDLIKQAEAAKDRAKADDENRHPRKMPAFVSEAELARSGYSIERL